MVCPRAIDDLQNEVAIERIRTTFDQVSGECQNSLRPLNLPEDIQNIKGKDGDFFYGINADGVEGIAVIHEMGVAIIYRDGSFVYPDGMEEPERGEEGEYDFFFSHFDTFLRHADMPDKIEDPLDDEIDVDAGFGAADVDGEPLEDE